jgi:FAD:protein FMN transferase
MKKSFTQKTLLILVLAISLISCSKSLPYQQIQGFTQGTTYSIVYQPTEEQDLQPEIERLLKSFDKSLSAYDSTSLISKINRNEDVKLDELFKIVFMKATEINKASEGAFDITIGPLARAFGFGPDSRAMITPELVDSLLQFVGMDKVWIENGKLIKSDPRIIIDVNAIAQGYSVDVVSKYLDALNIRNYLVEIGGEIRVKGKNREGNPWRVGVDKPVDNNMVPGRQLQVILQLNNVSLATSGNYRKFFEEDGIKYAHSIDPSTGWPVKHTLLSATVIANDCMTADAWATAFMVMGLEKSIDLSRRIPNLQVYFIYNDDQGKYQVYYTPGIESIIQKIDQNFCGYVSPHTHIHPIRIHDWNRSPKRARFYNIPRIAPVFC